MSVTLKTIARTLNLIRRFGIPSHILYFGDSLGDNLLLTTLAASLHHAGHSNIWIKCNHPALFDHNPHIRLVLPLQALLSTVVLKLFGTKVISPRYTRYRSETDQDTIPEKHIILKMADCLKLSETIVNKPVLILTASERAKGAYARKQIAISSSGAGALVPMRTKEWPLSRYQQVVNALHPEFEFVQLGTADDKLLDHVTDLRGMLSLRESAAVLANSLLVITHVGFIMHLARAMDCRAVIIYGGREAPWQSGYSCFENLYSNLACSPCWLQNNCPFGIACMDLITAPMVVAAAKVQLALHGQLLQEDELIND